MQQPTEFECWGSILIGCMVVTIVTLSLPCMLPSLSDEVPAIALNVPTPCTGTVPPWPLRWFSSRWRRISGAGVTSRPAFSGENSSMPIPHSSSSSLESNVAILRLAELVLWWRLYFWCFCKPSLLSPDWVKHNTIQLIECSTFTLVFMTL